MAIVKMIKDELGSPNGISTVLYKQGQIVDDMPDELAKVFVEIGSAEYSDSVGIIEGDPPEELEEDDDSEKETKMDNGAPENKEGRGRRRR